MDSGNGVRIGGHAAGTVSLPLRMANRHGLISGATGTGKTVTLQTIAEGFARAGVPVFLADVKGDLSGLAAAGAPSERISKRLADLGLQGYTQRACPTLFWDLYGRKGHPVRATISNMGPMLLASLLELNDTQTGVLHAVFKAAGRARRSDADRFLRQRRDLGAGRDRADDAAAPVRDVPAVADRRAVRATAGGGRSRQAAPGVLLRRGASAVR
jgi:DNA helicase HerA-like ATPase